MTPLLIFMGIPPATAVGTEAVQILGSSVSWAIAHSRKKNIDYEIGAFLLVGGIFGSTIGVILFNFLKQSGNIDLIIKFLYILFLAIIGSLMLIESSLSLISCLRFSIACLLSSYSALLLFKFSSSTCSLNKRLSALSTTSLLLAIEFAKTFLFSTSWLYFSYYD